MTYAQPIDIEAKRREKEEQAQRNRQQMPNVAKVVDEFRDVFGPGVRVLWAKDLETGVEAGKRSEHAERMMQELANDK